MSSSERRALRLTFHGRIIDHLGIQMYQSPVAAIAEIVSNSWDAEADSVEIDLPEELTEEAEIVVTDDGLGMTFEECQGRFLEVGLDTRGGDPQAKSPNKGRSVLGRKGIGKFAGFGIAEVMQIETISKETGERTVFKLEVNKLRGDEYIENDSKEIEVLEYLEPDEARRDRHGTVVKLQRLILGQRPSPAVFGRSMARRFLLHQRAADFQVLVNGEPIPESEDLEKVQFVFPRDYRDGQKPEGIVLEADGSGVEEIRPGVHIRWRFVFYEDTIDDEELRGIAVFAHDKMAQTPFFFNLVGGLGGQQGIEYLSGRVEADYLDELETDIIAPERQRIDWNRKATVPLLKWGQGRVKSLLKIWQDRRTEEKYRLLTDKLEPLAARLGKLPRHDRNIIERALKRFAGIPKIKEETFLEVSRSLLTAWEGGRLKDLIHDVSELDNVSGEEFVGLLMEAKVLTALHTAEAVRAKLLVIEGLAERIRKRELENAVRDYIAKNPWLVSPEWETFKIEKGVKFVIQDAAKEAGLDKEEEWRGRIDLVLASGDTLLIMEFMKPGVTLNFDHINRFNYYITAVRTRVESNSAGRFRRVIGGYLVADKLSKNPTLTALLNQLQSQGMRAMDWETLLQQAEAQWKEFFNILAERAPDDERVKALSDGLTKTTPAYSATAAES